MKWNELEYFCWTDNLSNFILQNFLVKHCFFSLLTSHLECKIYVKIHFEALQVVLVSFVLMQSVCEWVVDSSDNSSKMSC